MSNLPICGHPQCAGEAFCGYTGQPLAPMPVQKGAGGKVLWILGGVLVAGALLWIGRSYLISGAVSTYRATQPKALPTRYADLRIPGWTAGIPVDAVTVPSVRTPCRRR